MKNYYGFEYADGVNTTSGQPNTNPGKFNGYYNTAGELKLFASKSARDEWVEIGCSSRAGRVAVTPREARNLCAGMSRADYAEEIRWLVSELDND